MTNIPVGNGPAGIAVSPDGTRAYVSNQGSNTVSVIDTTKKGTHLFTGPTCLVELYRPEKIVWNSDFWVCFIT
ncbi:hypothetical protein [Pseudomonas fluorescens]|uniref:hypothetical protein n=1 Tax=Pseudomonas fluorescens TaxID=294 RepID=UPI001241B88E